MESSVFEIRALADGNRTCMMCPSQQRLSFALMWSPQLNLNFH